MVDQVLAILGIKKTAILVAGFFGAIMSLWFVTNAKTWPQRTFMVFGGTIFAAYATPLLGLIITPTEPMERGLSFMVGLFGLTLASAIFIGIRDTKLGDIIAGWFKRPGS